ncbi:MAG: YlxR family protein [Micromonosporaceae bacterium]
MVRRAYPVRTCVGCRARAPASELLRVVAVEHLAGYRLVPDPARRMPGRGAHLHPDSACLAKAESRRAFGRALRVSGVIDAGPLREHLGARP